MQPGTPLAPVGLEAGDVRLRPWQPGDIDDLWAALQDPGIQLWNSGGVTSRQDAAALLGRRSDWTAGDNASWAVVDAGTGALLGSISVHRASGRVAEKAGFRYEGHLRRSFRYGDGVKHDELLWSRLSDDPPPRLSSRS
jgi:RimJ/RimL family protein N-acetyltransferase